MTRPSSIDVLPEAIRDDLIQRLFESGFSGYTHHEEWAASLGYKVTRSAIHRFAQKIEDQMYDPDLRIRCAQAASSYSSADSIIANANALLRWVVTQRE